MIRFHSPSRIVLPSVAIAVLAGLGCGRSADKAPDTTAASAPAANASEAALMDSGTALLYTKKDPNSAVVVFAEMLKANPTHYGAHYQLAVALDSAGRVDEAKEAWQAFLPMAQAAKDSTYGGTAQRRLSAPPGALTDTQLMNDGVYLLYTKKDPATADARFRELLKRNPKHYGATYQLATALDREGKAAEARPLWQSMLKMAQNIKDSATIKTAATRLAQNP